MILNIETSSKICSVALSENGAVEYFLASEKEMDHAASLGPFVEECMKEIKKKGGELEAVAVSMGPGSYTGLRIGMSLAKGLCFGLDIPLVSVSTLELLAVKGMFSQMDPADNALYIPLIDARRMEVYTAVYNNRLEELMQPSALILDESSFSDYKDHPLVFIGDGVTKAKDLVVANNATWIDRMPTAADMTALSERAVYEKEFSNVAYSTPFYLKSFHATTPKNKI